jgi:hypothetical protein
MSASFGLEESPQSLDSDPNWRPPALLRVRPAWARGPLVSLLGLMLALPFAAPAGGDARFSVCPPARTPKRGAQVLLDTPANLRSSPGGPIREVLSPGSPGLLGGRAVVLGVRGSWYEIGGQPEYAGDRDPHPRGYVHSSNIQPVCMIRSAEDVPAGPDGKPVLGRIEGPEGIQLAAFGRKSEVFERGGDEVLLQTQDPDFPLGYFVNADEMHGGELILFGPQGFAVWKAYDIESSFGRVHFAGIRSDGEITIATEFECLPLYLTAKVKGRRVQLLGSKFHEWSRHQGIRDDPWLVGHDLKSCSMRRKDGREVELPPGERLDLLGLTPDARAIRVRRLRDGSEGIVDPAVAAACFDNRHCAG